MVFPSITASQPLAQIATAFFGLQAEISIFLIAFFAHAVFFGRYGIRGMASRSSKRKRSPSVGNPTPVARFDTVENLASSSSGSPGGPHARALAEVAETICKSGANEAIVAANIRRELEAVPKEEIVQALAALVQGAVRTKVVTPAVLATVRLLLREYDSPPTSSLVELILRGYLMLNLYDDFESFFQEVKALHGAVPSVSLLALKCALRTADLDLALGRLESVQSLWHEATPTASVAPQALLQQIVRLGAEQGAWTQLLQKLSEFRLLGESLHFLLAECLQRDDMATFAKVEQTGRALGTKLSTSSYRLLINGATTSADATRILAEADGHGALNKELCLVAIDRATAQKDVQLADALLKRLPSKADAETAGKLLKFYVGAAPAGRDPHSTIIQLYKDHFGGLDFSGDTPSQRLIVDAALQTGKTEILKQLLACTSDASKLVPLLKSFTAAAKLPDALTVFASCPDKVGCLYNAMIDLCIGGRQVAEAQKLMMGARAAGVADVATYNTMLKAHLAEGNVREAHKIIEAMRASNLQPNCVTFNELLDAKIKTNLKEAWALVDEMAACGVKANHITCSILLKCIQNGSQSHYVERILKVFEEMEGDMDEVLLSSVVEACIRVGRCDLLVPVLKKTRNNKRLQVKSPHTYGSIIRAYGFVKDMAAVWETWRELRARRIGPTSVALGCMVEALVTNGDTEAGYQLIKEIQADEECKHNVNAVIYCSVLKGFSHMKKFDRVWSVYQEMLGHKLQFSIVTFNTLVDACARSGEMGRIPQLLERMVEQGIDPNLITYSAILKGYCQEGRLEEAVKFKENMVQTTTFRPDEVMYNTLLDGCARQGLFDRGMSLLEEMQNNGVLPTNFTLSVLVKLASRSKRPTEAFELCDKLTNKYGFRLNGHVYSNLVQCCVVNKDLHRGLEVYDRMLQERVTPDARTYQILLRGCIQGKRPDQAASLIRAATGLRGGAPRSAAVSPQVMQPKGGLPAAMIEETLEGIAGQCCEEVMAVELLKDLRRVPRLRLDPKLQLRLTTKAAQM